MKRASLPLQRREFITLAADDTPCDPDHLRFSRIRHGGRPDELRSGLRAAYRLGATYVGQILQGAKPANLPVQQATKVELVINLRAAKVLGISFPLSLLGHADEVIA
jgi:hypothetical protein